MNDKPQTGFARELRRNQSDAEAKLWSRLRRSQLTGVKFRRQQPIGPYVVDFVSFEKSLIIEVDGGQHNEAAVLKADAERTHYLESRGFRVIRFWDNDVLKNIDGVGLRILECL